MQARVPISDLVFRGVPKDKEQIVFTVVPNSLTIKFSRDGGILLERHEWQEAGEVNRVTQTFDLHAGEENALMGFLSALVEQLENSGPPKL